MYSNFSSSTNYSFPTSSPSLLPPWLTPAASNSQSTYSSSSTSSSTYPTSRIHFDGRSKMIHFKIAICETTSEAFFILNTSFTTKDHYFRQALTKICDAFNAKMKDFGYTQQLEAYDPETHQYHVPQKHPFYE